MKLQYIFALTILIFSKCDNPSSRVNMQKFENIEIVKGFYETINVGHVDRLADYVADDFVDHNLSPGQPQGILGLKTFLQMVVTAFPDIQIKVEELIGEDSKVIARLTITGSHTGLFMGTIKPTNKKIIWTGIDIFELREKKIVGRWSERNLLSIMIQIGAFPK